MGSQSVTSIVCDDSLVSIKMLSVDQTFSRLFRPWDISDKNETVCSSQINLNCDETETNLKVECMKTKKRKLDETKRENRLRKIRGTFKKTDSNLHQDATVSTTTIEVDDDKKSTASVITNRSEADNCHVASLTLCCNRLLQEPAIKTNEIKEERKKEVDSKNFSPQVPEHHYNPRTTPNILPHASFSGFHPSFMPEYIPATDIAQALGVPATDPLLLESLAQGYAMEFEYARILQQENEAKLLNARKQRPKKYKCPHCQVGFSNNGQLKGHIRIHTGERPYKCDEKNCGKTFTRNEELTRHKRIHSGVRPFPCATCGKKFGRRDHLKKHTRTHYLQADRMMPVFLPLSAMPQVAGFPYLYGY